MRYFIAKNGPTVVEKRDLSGSDEGIDMLIAKYKNAHPTFTVEEIDKTSFDATQLSPVQTEAQAAWSAFKISGPTAAQAIAYLAKALGLE